MRRTHLNFWMATLLVGIVTAWSGAPAAAAPDPQTGKPGAQATPTPGPGEVRSPGAPEQTQNFDEWVAEMMRPRPYPKDTIVRIDENFARPHKAVVWKFRIVKEEGDTVWLQPLPPEDPGSPLHKFWLIEQERQAYIKQQLENPEQIKMINFDEPIPPLPFQDALRFEVDQTGLPRSGQWRNDFVLADLNGDGNQDLVMGPPREGRFQAPVILLGDGKGEFRQWRGTQWPSKAHFDYGGVAAGDFDHDGHGDIVMAVHFGDQYILYGDGKGDFSRFQKLPVPDAEAHSQAVTVADFDGDGWDDLAFLAEVSYDIKTSVSLTVPTVWVLENVDGKDWKLHLEGLPNKIMGMKLSSPDLDGDGRPDLLLSSSAQDWRNLVFFNRVDAESGKWTWATNRVAEVLAGGFHFTVVPEYGTGNQVLAVFQQFQAFKNPEPEGGRTTRARSGLVRYTIRPDGAVETRILEMDTTDRRTDPWWRLASGDIDGDGIGDAVVVRAGGGIQILLGDGEGGYIEEKTPEFEPIGRPYDVEIADLDGDGRGEIILMASSTADLPGGMAILRLAGPAEAGAGATEGAD